jgi:hypothetical protein
VAGVGKKKTSETLLNQQIKYAQDKKDLAEKQIIDANDQVEKLKLSIDKLALDQATEGEILKAENKNWAYWRQN